MKLHEDRDLFAELVQATASDIGLPEVYIEKDYWVTKALKHLSESSCVNEVVFKGGTSLSKAYRLIDRFSEDIYLAVFSATKSDSACKALLKSVENIVASGLIELKDDFRVSKGSKYRKTVYQYPICIDNYHFGQASSQLLIEVNAFTHPEPYELKKIQTLIAETLTKLNRSDLIAQFELESFSVNVLSVKRTLVEKMLGIIKDSYDKNPIERLSNRIRHLYDICLILRQDEYRAFVQSEEFMTLCKICINDEEQGFSSDFDYYKNPLTEAPLFLELATWRSSLEIIYTGIFSELVFGAMPKMDEIIEAINFLHENMTQAIIKKPL